MASFVPPVPHFAAPSKVVPTYHAKKEDARMKLWEIGMKAHHRALTDVRKLTDQSVPECTKDVSLKKARERARHFTLDQQRKQIEDENMALLGHIAEIVEKPSVTSKMIEEVPQPPKKKVQKHELHRKRVQRHIQLENQAMVKRLMAVKSCMDLKGCEKDYQRHRENVVRLKNVTDMNGPPPEKKRPRKLPALEGAPAPPSNTAKEHVRQGRGGALPPLQKSASAPSLNTQGKKGALIGHRDDEQLAAAIELSQPKPKMAWTEESKSSASLALAAGAAFAGLSSRGSSRMSIEAGATARSWLACSMKSFTPPSDVAFEACADVLDVAFDAIADMAGTARSGFAHSTVDQNPLDALDDSWTDCESPRSARSIELCSDDENSSPPSTPVAARLAADDVLSSILAVAAESAAMSP